jgi:predicted secreted protein
MRKNIKSTSIYSLLLSLILALTFLSLTIIPSKAIDPQYQNQMQRLTQILGSLYFLQPLCGYTENNWHDEVNNLIELDKPYRSF